MYKQCTNKTSISVRMCNKKETRSKLAANQVFFWTDLVGFVKAREAVIANIFVILFKLHMNFLKNNIILK